MKVLVTGANGMLGKAVSEEAAKTHEVSQITRIDGDLRNSVATDQIIHLNKPEVVINCAGALPGADVVELSVNVYAPRNLSRACKAVGARFVHVSTDCVFSGDLPEGMRYMPGAIPDPIDLYGTSKAQGEVIPHGIVVRTSFIGLEHGFLSWILGVKKDSLLQGYAKAFWSGSTVWEVARGLLEIAENFHSSPVVHLATPNVWSKLDMMTYLKGLLELPFGIEPVTAPYINRALEPSWFLRPVWNKEVSEELLLRSR